MGIFPLQKTMASSMSLMERPLAGEIGPLPVTGNLGLAAGRLEKWRMATGRALVLLERTTFHDICS